MTDEAVFATARLCVVGNINRDLKTAPLAPGAYLCDDGETSLDALDETIGGGGANSAAMAAGLGARASLVGQVGADGLGRRLEQVLQSRGVQCRLHRAPDLATGSTLNLVYQTGRRHFLSCHPNNAALAFERLDLQDLRQATHLLRADIWFSESMLYEGNQKVFEAARAAGVPASIDLNWDPQWGRASADETARRKAAVRRALPLVALAHGNVRELNELTGETELARSAARLLEWGVGAVVAHLGSSGAGWFSATETLVEPAAPVSRRRMVTGTGDLLSTCLMLMHHRADITTAERLRLANRIVGEFIQGDRDLIPRL